MAHFKKQILSVGKLYPSDGEPLEITPERLTHWHSEFQRLRSNKQRSTVHLNHPDDVNAMLPIPAAKFKKTRGAHNLAGELIGFELSEDGQSAVLTTDLFDKKAIEAAESDTVSLSPVILESFRDGAGNEYQDIVCGADLVIRPVDHRQGAFEPAGTIACALSLSATKKLKVYAMALDDDTPPEDDDEADAVVDDAPVVDDLPEEPTGKDAKIAACVSALANYGIALAEDTDSSTFFDRLEAALTALAAAKDEEDGGIESTPTEAPMVAAMSLESRTALAWAEGEHRKSLNARLLSLHTSGRCTPTEYKARSPKVGVVKLSLDTKTRQPVPSRLEDWIADREQLPAGTFHTAAQRAKTLSLTAVNPPKMSDELEPEDINAAVSLAFKR